MSETLRGITVSVFRDRAMPDCSRSGISARVDRVVLVGVAEYDADWNLKLTDLVKGTASPSPSQPAVVLVKRQFGRRTSVCAQPWGDNVPRHGWMSGGTYIATSDSRFGEASGFYGAVSLHDRRED